MHAVSSSPHSSHRSYMPTQHSGQTPNWRVVHTFAVCVLRLCFDLNVLPHVLHVAGVCSATELQSVQLTVPAAAATTATAAAAAATGATVAEPACSPFVWPSMCRSSDTRVLNVFGQFSQMNTPPPPPCTFGPTANFATLVATTTRFARIFLQKHGRRRMRRLLMKPLVFEQLRSRPDLFLAQRTLDRTRLLAVHQPHVVVQFLNSRVQSCGRRRRLRRAVGGVAHIAADALVKLQYFLVHLLRLQLLVYVVLGRGGTAAGVLRMALHVHRLVFEQLHSRPEHFATLWAGHTARFLAVLVLHVLVQLLHRAVLDAVLANVTHELVEVNYFVVHLLVLALPTRCAGDAGRAVPAAFRLGVNSHPVRFRHGTTAVLLLQLDRLCEWWLHLNRISMVTVLISDATIHQLLFVMMVVVMVMIQVMLLLSLCLFLLRLQYPRRLLLLALLVHVLYHQIESIELEHRAPAVLADVVLARLLRKLEPDVLPHQIRHLLRIILPGLEHVEADLLRPELILLLLYNGWHLQHLLGMSNRLNELLA
uniref:Uncharacterized protein n=1 Tax=Anopheles farauti TaxID=69004 RepID=A0A182QES1_9DIPT